MVISGQEGLSENKDQGAEKEVDDRHRNKTYQAMRNSVRIIKAGGWDGAMWATLG